MRVKRTILHTLITVFFVFLIPTAVTYATDQTSDYIHFPLDDDGEIFYRGETIDIYFEAEDVWEEWYTVPCALLYKNKKRIAAEDYSMVPAGGKSEEFTHFASGKLKDGTYEICVACGAVDEDGNVVPSVTDWEFDSISIELRTLKPPTGVKATAGEQKVTLSFNKCDGATKYEIYRSVKKSGGYKKIATVKKAQYVDKKVKKGKRYYYKIKAYRKAYNKPVFSKFSKVTRSKKIK